MIAGVGPEQVSVVAHADSQTVRGALDLVVALTPQFLPKAWIVRVEAAEWNNRQWRGDRGEGNGVIQEFQVSLGSSAVLYHILYSVIVPYSK